MSVTIEQIAAKAGVSAGTVSRVLNGKNKENRPAIAARSQRIRQLAEQMGYRPNVAARSMLTGRFGLVSLLTCGVFDKEWFPRPLLHGLHDALAGHDTRLVVNEFREEGLDDPEFLPQLFRESAVDGLILHINQYYVDRFASFFRDERLPHVTVNANHHRGCVYPDDLGGSLMLTRDVIRRGHRHIAYFGRDGSPVRHFSELEREAGFKQACAEAGITPLLVYNSPFEQAQQPLKAQQEAMELFRRDRCPTAVVCYEMEQVVAVQIAAARSGLHVPDDVLVAGFHENEIRAALGAVVALTAIVPFRTVAARAVDMLMHTIEAGERHPRSICVPYEEMKW